MFAAPLSIPGFSLRIVEDRHVGAVYETVRRNLEHLKPWMPWATDEYSLDGCRAWQRKAIEQFARNDGFNAGIFDGPSFIGVIGVHAIDWWNRKTTVGYWIDAAYQGRGIMTAACRVLLSHLFDELKLNRVEIHCATQNVRSCAIPKRLGFVDERVAREAELLPDGRYLDHAIYTMLASEWKGLSLAIVQ
ncbi:GNAT family N-acetyltransferase [Humisphaera borealis]|uniref:GNAT family N-acetyltransferase n=1 Tax=Humisphaera borealis TaxID=2807512 RepID=A0A7M2WZ97_9BACT|nr:GNAT family N-acetyltransferase [Humisphaera borealis]QOV90795.1 GNAT family N-acetyltransferase [Humisphaera borealis]